MKFIAGMVLVALAMAGGAYFLQQESSGPTTKEYYLVVSNKKLAGPTTLTAGQGDTVVLQVTADEAEEFHLHGYDRVLDLQPGVQSTLTLTANMSGRFVFELEHSKTELGALEVYPR